MDGELGEALGKVYVERAFSPAAKARATKMVDEIEQELYKMGQVEIPTGVIGEMVMERLRKLDDIAYIRFASVYRSYPDIQAMRQELDRLLAGGNGNGSAAPAAGTSRDREHDAAASPASAGES